VKASPLEQLSLILNSHGKRAMRRVAAHPRALNPEVAIIFGAAASYRRAGVGSFHDDAHADNLALHTGKVYSFPLLIKRKTTSCAAGIGLGTTIKYPRRTTGAAAGNGLGATPIYLRAAAGNGRAQRSSTFGAQRAPPRATAWAQR
jgi:hypothetical protein